MGYDMYMVESKNEDSSYFRANIWGMGILRSAMKEAQVLDLEYEDPGWPEIKRLANESDETYYDRVDDAHDPIRGFRSASEKLVPVGKFCSNDGWVVTPEECEIIANGLDTVKGFTHRGYMSDPIIIEAGSENLVFVKEFADYCRRAAKHGGFKVW